MNNAGASDSFPGYKASFKCKEKLAGSKEDNGTKAVQIIVLLKYLSNFSRILQKPWNNCEIKLILRWSENCVIYNTAAKQDTTFARNDTKLHVLVLTLSTDDKEKLLQQLKSRLKRTINAINMNQNQQNRMLQTNVLIFQLNQIFRKETDSLF